MKRFILTAMLLAFAASLALAAPSLSRAAFPDHRTVAARHPQSDAVVLYDSLVVSMDEGGRITKRHHRAAMLFTDNAINRYGDPRILFDADREELRVLTVRAHMRDGSAVEAKGPDSWPRPGPGRPPGGPASRYGPAPPVPAALPPGWPPPAGPRP